MTHSRSIAAPSAVYGLQFLGFAAWIGYANLYFAALGVDLAQIGLLAALPSAVAIVAAPFWGQVADRLGDMRVPYLAAASLAAASVAVLATGPQMPLLAFVVIAMASGSSGMIPLLDARAIARLGPERNRYGMVRAWGSISFVVVSPLLGILSEAAGIRAVWLVYIAGVLAAAVTATLTLGRDHTAVRARGMGPLGGLRLLRLPGLGLIWIGAIATWMAYQAVLTFYAIRIQDLGGDGLMVGLGWSVSALFEIPLMLLFPRLARRWPVERLVVGGILVMALRAAAWAVVTGVGPVIATTAIGGIGFAPALVGLATYVSRRAPSDMQATAQALFGATTFALGNILGSVIAGLIAGAWGIAAVYPAGAAGSVAGAVLVWAGMRLASRSAAASPAPAAAGAVVGEAVPEV